MSRPLIDFLHVDDLPWEPLPVGRARTLSRDRENGETSMVVELPPGGETVVDGPTELFVLAGAARIGPHTLSRYSYVQRPAGEYGPLRTDTGCLLLFFGKSKEPPAGGLRGTAPPEGIAPLNLATMDWERPKTPSFPAGAARKTLRMGTSSGFWVLGLLPHWKSALTEWHTADEENFLLEGEIETAQGRMRAGAYLAHPAGVVHGPMRSRPGCLVITRAGLPFDTTYAPVGEYGFPPEH
jgi:hypothetical protein